VIFSERHTLILTHFGPTFLHLKNTIHVHQKHVNTLTNAAVHWYTNVLQFRRIVT